MNIQNDDVLLNQIHLPEKVAVLGKGMLNNNALLSETLQTHIVRHYPVLPNSASDIQAYLGWGNKKSYQRAKRTADKRELPVYSVEDGFLRSLDSGIHSRYALSMIIDDLGIYYDQTAPSRLESMICHRLCQVQWSNQHLIKSQQLIASIINSKLSKYNDTLSCPSLDDLIQQSQSQNKSYKNHKHSQKQAEHVLLIDQVLGDKSLAGACLEDRLSKKQFTRMLKDVFKNHPEANIWIKAHPAGNKGYLTSSTLIKLLGKYKSRIRILNESMNSIGLLKQVQHVYTVSSHMGFEGLMLASQGYDINVHAYGVSWYAGWGLTDDSGISGKVKKLLAQVEKRRLLTINQLNCQADNKLLKIKSLSVSVEQLFFAGYLDYSHYVDPASQKSTDLQKVIDWLKTNRYWHNQLSGELTLYEFSRWKLPFVRAFVEFPKTKLFIKPKPRFKNLLHPDHFRVDFDNPILVWGLSQRQKATHIRSAKRLKSKQFHAKKGTDAEQFGIYCMEDGFIRSNGLGATLLAPLSVVIDKSGIYYDATQSSDLEYLLKKCQQLSQAQQKRVARLKEYLLERKVSKYNVGKPLSELQNKPQNSWIKSLNNNLTQKKILIVGQVEDDLSVQYCGSLIKTNAELIQRVNQDNPDAFLIYKPHPDVEMGLRTGKVNRSLLEQVDAVARDVTMPDCLSIIDEVHTISSLTGFEALLRNKSVVCYGMPFYAGWGLTKDMDSQLEPKQSYLARRKRLHSNPLTLEQLIHCTLIEYPLYRLPNGYGLAQIEQVIDYLYQHIAPKDSDVSDIEKWAAKNSTITKMNTQSSSLHTMTTMAKTWFMQARHMLLSSRKNKP